MIWRISNLLILKRKMMIIFGVHVLEASFELNYRWICRIQQPKLTIGHHALVGFSNHTFGICLVLD